MSHLLSLYAQIDLTPPPALFEYTPAQPTTLRLVTVCVS